MHPDTCARCGHTSGGCQRCGRYDDDLGAAINDAAYCHNTDGETCYMATSQVDRVSGHWDEKWRAENAANWSKW